MNPDNSWIIELIEGQLWSYRHHEEWRRYITRKEVGMKDGEVQHKACNLAPSSLEEAIVFLRNRFTGYDMAPPSMRFVAVRIRNLVTNEIIPFEALGI